MLKYAGIDAYFVPDLAQLEKQRGILGMTWRLRVPGVVISVLILVLLAVASGATWTDQQFGTTWTDLSSDLWAGLGW
jgi:hypothetical protein